MVGGEGITFTEYLHAVQELENYDKVQNSASLLTKSNINCLSENVFLHSVK